MEQYAFQLLCYQGKINYPPDLQVGYLYCQYLRVYVPVVHQWEKCMTMFKVHFVRLSNQQHEQWTNRSTIITVPSTVTNVNFNFQSYCCKAPLHFLLD